MPDFRDPAFLRAHIAHTMAFYHPRCIDPDGGFHHYFTDDGTVSDASHRHLVSSTRFIVNYALAAREFADDPTLQRAYVTAAHHGIDYLRRVHRNPRTGGYAWTVNNGRVEDDTNHCYGLAFVLLAYSAAVKAGIAEAQTWIDETYELLEERFWDPVAELYRDEADADWNVSGYRGQNANMHTCEAMLAAYEASGDDRYLERASTLADHITRREAGKAGGLIWEHYDADLNVDWTYNLHDPTHLFRPWGYQSGHQTEWAKLLLILDRHHAQDWLVERACDLFDRALEHAWDTEHGGIVYGIAFDGIRPRDGGQLFRPEGPVWVCDDDKYFWVQAESLAAAALLAHRTGDARYWDTYERIWSYAWEHFVDHEHGAWYRILTRDNHRYSDAKSPAGKTDYHTIGACYEALAVLRNEA